MSSENKTRPHSKADSGRLFEEFPPSDPAQWRAEVDRLLKGVPYEKRMLTNTPEGIILQPIYRREDSADIPHIHALPGFSPFHRGGHAVKNGGNTWEIAQETSGLTPQAVNAELRHDLKCGQTAINLILDRASRLGFDPDQAQTEMVGADGVSISSARELAVALAGIDIQQTPVYIHAGNCALPYLGFLLAVVKEQKADPTDLRGAVAIDPLGELVACGSIRESLTESYDDMARLTAWASEHAPQLGTIWIHAGRYHDGGASAVQELAFALATGVAYLREMDKRNLALETVVPRMRFSFAVGTHFFMEVAKLRAARLLWNRILESCDITESVRAMWMHVRTSRQTKTTYDPHVNLLRATTEAFSGIVGGADSLHVAPFDEQVHQPDDFSRRIARNMQNVLKDESHLSQIIDPAGGSWYVERLTADLAEAAWKLLQDVETRGGMFAALQEGFPQAEIAAVYEKRADDFASRKTVMVGINNYPNLTERKLNDHVIDRADFLDKRSRAIQAVRTGGDHQSAVTVLQKLTDLLDADQDAIVSAVIDAAAYGATLGEIHKTLHANSKPAPTVTPIPVRRLAEPLEKLRRAIETKRVESGGMKVYLATLGPVGKYMPRLDFAASFFEIGGFEVIRTMGHDTPEEAAQKALDAKANIVVICGRDDDYTTGAPAVARKIKAANASAKVVLAGLPDEETRRAFTEAGVDEFIHIKSNLLKTLQGFAAGLGVSS
ncbi:MAG: acyl-CoA mutase large subunit family protein [candidate division Zixibacteria bacterium]|nr:acyl-CoA mutase large subunit family protein [candidate division Zixibacteria bacterium]